jgi:general secretion pathway protein F
MKLDEFSFVNQQLAGMLKAGIPLEAALHQLCETMRAGELQTELRHLEADLVAGMPLREALPRRKLPPFYVQMLQAGARANDLPGVLTMLADHYNRSHLVWVRLKGLLFYPFIVLLTSLALSLLIALVYGRFIQETAGAFGDLTPGAGGRLNHPGLLLANLWLPVVFIGFLCVAAAAVLLVPRFRRSLRWRVPAFKEAGLSQLASALALMLEKGCNLNEALALLQSLEASATLRVELGRWQSRLAAGVKGFPELTAGGKIIPPLFVWLVAGSGEDWVAGFRQAARVYYDRAVNRVELMLYAALPFSVLALGLVILSQVLPTLRVLGGLFTTLTDFGDVGQ